MMSSTLKQDLLQKTNVLSCEGTRLAHSSMLSTSLASFVISGKSKTSTCEDFMSTLTFSQEKEIEVIVVADGHAGRMAAWQTAYNLPAMLVDKIMTDSISIDTCDDTIKQVFSEVNKSLDTLVSDRVRCSGTTCLVFLRIDDKAKFAWVGDSQAYVLKGSDIIYFTPPHIIRTVPQNGQPYELLFDSSGKILLDKEDTEGARVLEKGGKVLLERQHYENYRSFLKPMIDNITPSQKHYQIPVYEWICCCGYCNPGFAKCMSNTFTNYFSIQTTRSLGDLPPMGLLRKRFLDIHCRVPEVSPVINLAKGTSIILGSDGLWDVVNNTLPNYMSRDNTRDLGFSRFAKIAIDPSLSFKDRLELLVEDVKERYSKLWIISQDISQMDDIACVVWQF